jgi:hypothetical protein
LADHASHREAVSGCLGCREYVRKELPLFPVQKGPFIPWSVAEFAYMAYAKRYGTSQSLERLAQRGGFHVDEMDDLYPAWRDAVLGISEQRRRAETAEADCQRLRELAEKLTEKLEEMSRTVTSPEVQEFVKGVELEASHQRLRWPAEHDAGKTDADWFWLVGYLVGKALHQPEKRLHHQITAAAALANWHRQTVVAAKPVHVEMQTALPEEPE